MTQALRLVGACLLTGICWARAEDGSSHALRSQLGRARSTSENTVLFPNGSVLHGAAVSGAVAINSAVEGEFVNSIGMKFRLIPAGSFPMGSKNGDVDEKPVHRVTIARPFYIGVCEVTQEQWEGMMGANPSKFKGPTNQVDSVSWDDVHEFNRKLSQKEGVEYRLPTEAEWEYACRAGTTTRYYWGDEFDPRHAWVEANSEGKTHPVGQKAPNAWGLYDMNGNLHEWCEDWHGDYPEQETKDPQGASDETSRVCRGGVAGPSTRGRAGRRAA